MSEDYECMIPLGTQPDRIDYAMRLLDEATAHLPSLLIWKSLGYAGAHGRRYVAAQQKRRQALLAEDTVNATVEESSIDDDDDDDDDMGDHDEEEESNSLYLRVSTVPSAGLSYGDATRLVSVVITLLARALHPDARSWAQHAALKQLRRYHPRLRRWIQVSARRHPERALLQHVHRTIFPGLTALLDL